MVAQPLRAAGKLPRVAVYSRDFEDVRETVAFVRDRVLLATSAALLIALFGGYLVAARLARRVGHLERAARHVARGRFMEPLPVTSRDELGQLTETFNEMQQQLRRVDVARKEFIATASHELRTPIFSLSGFVELLQDEDLDEETRREFLETMSEQVARLQKLAVDLLDLSRLDSGSVELHTEPVDLAELTRSVAGEFHPFLEEHRTKLRVDVADEGPNASCDRERVAQIMRILLDNALRHTPEGTDVTVSAQRYNGVGRAHGGRHGPRPPGGGALQGVRALLHGRRGPRRRPRARDRARAGRADGRPAAAPDRRRHGVHARTAHGRHDPVRTKAAALAAAVLLLAAGCNSGDDGASEPAGPREVTTTRVQVVEGLGSGGGFDPAQIYDRLSPGVVTILSIFNGGSSLLEDGGEGGQGSGFVLDGNGYIATNAHVVTTEGTRRHEAGRPGLHRVPRRQPRAG